MTSLSFYSTQTSRYERSTYFSHAIEKEQGRSVAFQSLDKKDRIAFLALCNISTSTIHWNKIGKQKMRNCVQQILHGPRLINLLQIPPQDMTKAHLNPFLTGRDLANLQSTYKAAPELGSATRIIKTYNLAPLIAKYCHRYCDTLTEEEQIKILSRLMSVAKDLSELEQLEEPNYQSVAKFFEIVEARNLIRMAARMHRQQPLADLEDSRLEIAEDSEGTIERAENIRGWFDEHQAALQVFHHLDLNDCDLTLLPSEIRQLSALALFSLGDNRLASLPKEIGQLKALTLLCLDRNHLTSLPKEIGQLRALTFLSLFDNHLTSLPKEIGQLRALIELYLLHNRLTSLPKEIGQIRVLTVLHLSNNRLTSVPKEIGQLRALENFTFDRNGIIDRLPVGLGGCSIGVQNKALQMQAILGRLRKCLKGKHDCKGIAGLLAKMEKFLGKQIRSKLHGCIYKACKQEKSLTAKMKSPQFGRKALIDPTIDPKLKLAGLERFERMV